MTARQYAVAVLVAEGKTDKEIGAALGIADNTVGVHVARAATALGLRKDGNTRVLIARAVLKGHVRERVIPFVQRQGNTSS